MSPRPRDWKFTPYLCVFAFDPEPLHLIYLRSASEAFRTHIGGFTEEMRKR